MRNYEIREITPGRYGSYIVTRKSEKYGIFMNGRLIATDSSKKGANIRINMIENNYIKLGK